jgi:hypothetical protein
MPEPKVTSEEINTLREKVDTSGLEPEEKRLLDDILVAARDWIRNEEESAETESMLTQLRRQLARSFLPGDTSGFGICFYKITPQPPPRSLIPYGKITPHKPPGG